MMGIAITLAVCVLGGAIWFFMSKADHSGPDNTKLVTPGTPQRPNMGGGGGDETTPKGAGSASQ